MFWMTELTAEPKNPYSAFLLDVRKKEPNILPEPELRRRVEDIRNVSLSDAERLKARNEVFDSALRIIPFAIKTVPSSGIPPEELVGEAYETIDRCIENFNLKFISKHTEEPPKFSTYVIESLKKKLSSPKSAVRVNEPISVPDGIDELSVSMRCAR
jgi:hypothetical protein